jgi:hypothetical protein
VEVEARRWHQGGEAVELAQPVQGERWAGAVAQQRLTSSTVLGVNAHRAIDGEAAAMLPLPHRLRVIGMVLTCA